MRIFPSVVGQLPGTLVFRSVHQIFSESFLKTLNQILPMVGQGGWLVVWVPFGGTVLELDGFHVLDELVLVVLPGLVVLDEF